MKKDDKLGEVKNAVKNFINKQNLSDNQLGIISFGSKAKINSDLTSEKSSLAKEVEKLQTNGSTRMDLAIEAATKMLSKTDENTEDYILLFTDGKPVIDTAEPQAIVLLIDRSSSMNGQKLNEVKDSAKQFVARQIPEFSTKSISCC